MEIQNDKEQMLWKMAKKRVGFKNHLFTYLAVNLFLWAMWYFTDRNHHVDINDEEYSNVPWPLFSSLGWGFGLFWHFMGAYIFGDKVDQVEKEYERLKKKQN